MFSAEPEESSTINKTKRRKHKPNGFEEWGGYMNAKKMKLDIQFDGRKALELASETETQIFKGIAIFVNGYTKPPADELKRLMLIHGGKYHHYYYSSKTTHVIASNLPASKIKHLKTMIVVKADWITDSIKAGKLLPHHEYLLYTPEMVDKQHRLQIGKYFEKDSASILCNQKHAVGAPLENSKESLSQAEVFENDLRSNSQLEINQNFQHNENNNSMSHVKTSTSPDVSPQKHGLAIKAGHPEFLSEYYNHSRLHHISTAGQELKRYVQSLVKNNKDRYFPKREKLKSLSQQQFLSSCDSYLSAFEMDKNVKKKSQHTIMHLDMDCFFVSVGLKKHPELKGHPVAVTHSKGKRGGPQEGSDINYEASHYTNESEKKINGITSTKGNAETSGSNEKQKVSIYSKEYGSLSEIASCSYEARKAGVRNGMFLGEALRRCPTLKTMPYDFEGYSEVSRQLYDIVASYTLDIEAVSCDELYIDCTELLQDVQLTPFQFASMLRAEIEKETGCTASAGMGCNMLLARLANKVAKPNGQHYVCESEIEEFMKKQKVGDLPGVGYTTTKRFQHLNVKTCGDLQNWSLSKLQQEFGPKTGQSLYDRCRGKYDRSVQCHKDRKSVSAEINYGIRFETEEDVYKFITELAREVQNRVQNIGCKGKLLTLKLMIRKSDAPVETAKFMGHGVCDHFSKSVALKTAIDNAQVIAKECCAIARSFKVKPQDYRGMGIQLSKLEPVQKEGPVLKTMKSFLSSPNNESSNQAGSNVGVFSPKNLDLAHKAIPEKATIKHFLSNKVVSPSKLLDCNPANTLQQDSSSAKKVEPLHKHVQENKTIKHFLSNDSSALKRQPCATVIHREELDPNVLGALPPEIREEILEFYKIKSDQIDMNSVPAGITSHNSSSLMSRPNEALNRMCTTPKNENFGAKDWNVFETASSVFDESFLNALPDELRKEVLESHGPISIQNGDHSAMTDIDKPSTSRASMPKVSPLSVITPTLEMDRNIITSTNSIPSLEVDDSFLDALPEDLKKEVLESHYQQALAKRYETSKPSSLKQSLTSNENPAVEKPEPQASETNSNQASDESTCKKEANLAGAVEIDDIRALVKEWVNSTEEPLDEDINDLKNFLVEIVDSDICKLDLVLKYLYRLAKKANEKWKQVYLSVLSSVQEKVKILYDGRTLWAKSDFKT